VISQSAGATFTGGTLTSPLLAANGSAAAPSFAWSAGGGNDGFYSSDGITAAYSINGTPAYNLASSLTLASNRALGFASGTNAISNAADSGIKRIAAGTLQVTDGGAGVGALFTARVVEANTAVAASPNVLTTIESSAVLTNEGTAAANYHALPSAVAGLQYTFVVQDTDGMRIVAGAGDNIRMSDKKTADAGYVESTAVGSTCTLVAINATEWVAIAILGTWTDGTFTYSDATLTSP
jgi:hypothetical protein